MSDETGWTVVSTKKKPKKKQVHEEDEAKSSISGRKKKDLYRDEVQVEDPSQFGKAAQSKSGKKPTSKGIHSERDMVELCVSLVVNTPQERLAFAGLVERIQSVTGHAWNRKYKGMYGSIKEFIGKHAYRFEIVDGDKVALKATPQLELEKSPARSKAKTKPVVDELKVQSPRDRQPTAAAYSARPNSPLSPSAAQTFTHAKIHAKKSGHSIGWWILIGILLAVLLLFLVVSVAPEDSPPELRKLHQLILRIWNHFIRDARRLYDNVYSQFQVKK